MKKYDLPQLDGYIRSLTEQASTLQNLRKPWADHKAATLLEIAELVRDVRSSQQMTGLMGKPIVDEQGPPPYRAPSE